MMPTLIAATDANRQAWADPEHRARRSAAISAARSDPEAKAVAAEKSKGAWADPEKRARMIEGIRRAAAMRRKPERSGSARKRGFECPPQYRAYYETLVRTLGPKMAKSAVTKLMGKTA